MEDKGKKWIALVLLVVVVLTSLPVLAYATAEETQLQVEKALEQYDRNTAYDLLLDLEEEQGGESTMQNLSRRIWISKHYSLYNDTVKAGIALMEAATEAEHLRYQLEAMDTLAFIDYYNFDNDLALKKWNTVATMAVSGEMEEELYRYYWGLALLAVDEKNYGLAIAYYEKAISLAEEGNLYGADGSRISTLLYSALSEVYITCGKYDLAIEADKAALADVSLEDLDQRYRMYLHLAEDYFLNGESEASMDCFVQANALESSICDRLLNTLFVKRMNRLEAAVTYANGEVEAAAHLFYEDYMQEQDTSNSIDLYIEVQNTASSYETSAVEKEMNLLTQLQKEQDSRLWMQNSLLLLSGVFILVLLIILVRKVISLRQQREQKEVLFHLAITDQLTQIKNRRQIMEEYATIDPGSKCVALLDIDSFKEVNDVYGHLVGDMVLRRVADTIKASLREGDEVGRYGGEEFLLLLDTPLLEDAKAIAERVRSSIEQLTWDWEGLHVTVSIGLVHAAELCGDALLVEADNRLYVAKNSGRNRLVTEEVVYAS